MPALQVAKVFGKLGWHSLVETQAPGSAHWKPCTVMKNRFYIYKRLGEYVDSRTHELMERQVASVQGKTVATVRALVAHGLQAKHASGSFKSFVTTNLEGRAKVLISTRADNEIF